MNKALLTSLVSNPYSISNADVEALEKLVENFPYCQIARILIAKAAYDKGSMFSEKKTKTAAAYTASRKTLKHLLISKSPNATTHESVPVIPEYNNEVTIVNQEKPTEVTKSKDSIKEYKSSVFEVVKEEIKIKEPVSELPSLNDEINHSLAELSKKKEVALQSIKDNLQKETERIQPKNNVEDLIPTTPTEDQASTETIAQDLKTGQNEESDKTLNNETSPTPTLDSVVSKADNNADVTAKAEEEINPTPHPKEEVTGTTTSETVDTKSTKKRGEKRVVAPNTTQENTQQHAHLHLSESRLGDEISKDLGNDVSTDLLLHYLEYRKNKSKEIKEVVKQPDKIKEDSLSIIEDFIQKEPSITKVNKKVPTNTQDLSVDSIKENEKLYTENLAKINIMQGNFDKAIRIYEVLMMKYPQKKSYFAEQIENLNNR